MEEILEIGIAASVSPNETGRETPRNLAALLASNAHRPLRLIQIANDALYSPKTLNAATLGLIEAAVNGLPQCYEKDELKVFIRQAREKLPADVDLLATYMVAEFGAVIVDTPSLVFSASEPITDNSQGKVNLPYPDTSVIAPEQNAAQGGTLEIRTPVELARLAILLGIWRAFCAWLFGREDARQRNKAEGKGYGYFTFNGLTNSLQRHGVKGGRTSVLAWLKDAEKHGFLTRVGDRYYFIGIIEMARLLTQMAVERGLAGAILQDKPGGKDMYVDLSGDKERSQAFLYDGWIYVNGDPTISRDRLMELFGVKRQTLRKWERIAGIQVTANYAQTVDPNENRIPDHAMSAQFQNSADTQRIGYIYQRPNTYHAGRIRQHNHVGQGGKIRKVVNDVLSVAEPPNYGVGEQPKDVRNFAHENPLDGWKAYQKARKTRSVDEHPMDYLRLGSPERRARRVVVWELLNGDRPPQTSCGDYIPQPRYQRVQYHEI